MRRTLVCRLDNLGDVLLTGPAVRAVAAGSDQVIYLAGPKGRDAAEILPGVDEIVEHRAAWIDPDGGPTDKDSIDRFVTRLAAVRASHAVVLTSFHQSPLPMALLLRMAGVPVVAAVSDDYPGSLLDVRHRLDPNLHEVERNLSLVATLGYRLPPGDDGRLGVMVPEVSIESGPAEPFVVVHPGASAPARTAEPDLFASVVAQLVAEGWRVAVTGGSSETRLTRAVAGRNGGVVDLGGRTDLRSLVALLSRAEAIIVGNTGPAHLAAAVGLPVVQIYPPTVPAPNWRPWAVPHAVLGNQDISCAGCRATECPLATHLCVSEVTPEETVAAVRRVIADRDYLYPSQAVGSVMA